MESRPFVTHLWNDLRTCTQHKMSLQNGSVARAVDINL